MDGHTLFLGAVMLGLIVGSVMVMKGISDAQKALRDVQKECEKMAKLIREGDWQ